MNAKQWWISGVGVIIVALALIQLSTSTTNSPVLEPVATTTPESVEEQNPETPVVEVPIPKPFLVTIETGDTIASWSIEGYLNDGGEKEAVARKEIIALKNRLGGDDDYQINLSIAQKYEYLGEGRLAYEHLSKAIALDTSSTSGTAWHNMGMLMEKLGAYHTARVAHTLAVANQPNIPSFHISRLEFMIYRFTKDTAGVEEVFKDTTAILGAEDPMLVELRARWEALK